MDSKRKSILFSISAFARQGLWMARRRGYQSFNRDLGANAAEPFAERLID